jgi:serine/threonine-protein kinase
MTSHRDAGGWARLGPLVADLAELSADDQAAALARLDDPIFRAEARRLLDAMRTDGAAFDQPALTLLDGMLPPDDPGRATMAGTRVGDWRLLREISRGGMGTVYEAEREGEGFRQRAAVKMLREDRAVVLAAPRFRRERQLLARLRHRNVATLLDGGMTADHRLWFAMELVEGDPITTWCVARRLGVAARLALFRQVCNAVHHAHRELVLHRDLKPGNILVTTDGTVKLLDFGIAKLLEPEPTDPPDITLTGRGATPATPTYASPEQLTDGRVTVASDIYSLGVVLYELLAGRPPFIAAAGETDQWRRLLTDDPPSMASVATADAALVRGEASLTRLRRRLHGDVERVVGVALRKAPEARYASVEQFSADVERLLSGQPVLARGGGRLYRLGRFVARNPVATTITIALATGLVAATGIAADRARRADRARASAELAAARTRRVTAFLADALRSPDPWTGSRDVTVREVLNDASRKAARDFAGEPEVQAAVRLALGQSYLGLGRWVEAERELRAVDTLARDSTLLAERRAARQGLAQALAEEERWTDARAWYDSATRLAGADSLALATVLADLAWLHGQMGAMDSAQQAAEQAVALRRRHGAPPIELANALNNLAVVELQRDHADSAMARVEEAITLLEGTGPAGEPPLAAALATLAGMRSDRGDYAEADARYRQSLALRRRIFGPGHPDEIGTLVNLAANAVDAGRPADALALTDTVLGASPSAPQSLVAAARTVRGRALAALDRLTEAETELRSALALRRRLLPPGHPSLAFTLTALADVLEREGRSAAALPLATEAWTTLRDAIGPESPRTLHAAEQVRRLSAPVPLSHSP